MPEDRKKYNYVWENKERQREIKIPPNEEYLNWPAPYSWMLHDLSQSIKNAEANYLVGLGLFCYSEIIGREILKKRLPNQKKFKNPECFNVFLKEYMGYVELINNFGPKIYDWFRHGLCHEYLIKINIPGGKSGIYLFRDEKEDISNYSFDITKGIVVSPDEKFKILLIEPYLENFKDGIKKFLIETGQI